VSGWDTRAGSESGVEEEGDGTDASGAPAVANGVQGDAEVLSVLRGEVHLDEAAGRDLVLDPHVEAVVGKLSSVRYRAINGFFADFLDAAHCLSRGLHTVDDLSQQGEEGQARQPEVLHLCVFII
jgi:hypothetical protein